MKIALLAIGGFDRSGTGKVIPCLLWLTEQLTQAGHEVHVFVPAQEAKPATWSLGSATIHNAGRRWWRVRTLAAMAREHGQAPFEVIHAFWANMGTVGAVASKLLRVPMVLTLPGGDAVSIPAIGYGALLSLRGRLSLAISARAAVQVTVPSRYAKDLAARRGVAAIVVPLGVDIGRLHPVAPRPRDLSNPLRLVHVASLNRVKDQPTLLEAARILKARRIAFELRIIGPDTLGGETQRLSSRFGLDDEVRFLGALEFEALRDQYRWADMLVMASRHEAGPLVMLEAALAGIPTVGTRVGHLADHSPRAAIAVPIGDAQALAQAIESLAADEDRRVAVARAAQAFAVEHDAAYTAGRLGELYRSVLGG